MRAYKNFSKTGEEGRKERVTNTPHSFSSGPPFHLLVMSPSADSAAGQSARMAVMQCVEPTLPDHAVMWRMHVDKSKCKPIHKNEWNEETRSRQKGRKCNI